MNLLYVVKKLSAFFRMHGVIGNLGSAKLVLSLQP